MAPITIETIMASAALPIFFPAVQIGSEWYGDGGIRLAAPLSPALHLGADRILAISTRYDRTTEESRAIAVGGYPPPAQVLGLLLNAVFLDLVDQDALRLERLNGCWTGCRRRTAWACGMCGCCTCGRPRTWACWRRSSSRTCRGRSVS
jgi:predicted acylesterase/phospholipase RssA